MDAQQIHIGVNLGVQKVNSNAFDNLLEEEIDYYVNKAIREYIRRQNVYLKEGNLKQASRQDYIADSEASHNLGSLLQDELFDGTDLETADNFSNARRLPLSSLSNSLFAYVHGQSRPNLSTDWSSCKLISPSEIHEYSKTESNLPIFRRNPVVFVGDYLYIFYDEEDGNVSEFTLIYIKEPSVVALSPTGNEVSTPELPSHTHDDIVDLAVGMIIEDIKSARPYEQNQQTIKGENN